MSISNERQTLGEQIAEQQLFYLRQRVMKQLNLVFEALLDTTKTAEQRAQIEADIIRELSDPVVHEVAKTLAKKYESRNRQLPEMLTNVIFAEEIYAGEQLRKEMDARAANDRNRPELQQEAEALQARADDMMQVIVPHREPKPADIAQAAIDKAAGHETRAVDPNKKEVGTERSFTSRILDRVLPSTRLL